MTPKTQRFSAHGKLMLFGEYVVMRGVPALAFPTTMGQSLTVKPADAFEWKSYETGQLWFSLRFDNQLNILETNNEDVAHKLMQIFADVKSQNPGLFSNPLSFETQANFNRSWGFGSSATLISLIAQWSGVDAYTLNEKHFGGSGYDIACATAEGSIQYERDSKTVKNFELPKSITDKMLFVYLGKKQNSQQEVSRFGDVEIEQNILNQLKEIIVEVTTTHDIEQFEACINQHEQILSEILQRPTLKSAQFPDYPYEIKSLGAWGGDFFMATCRDLDEAKIYFIDSGRDTIFTFNELINETL
jgi:mevalonate kinase